MEFSYGSSLSQAIAEKKMQSLMGVYDVFSASIAARYYDGLFISGFGFAASHYGLPDIGFIAWSDILAFVQRVRTVLPQTHIVVDIDDGYCDVETACHVVSLLENMGASAVVLEDQKRPRKCGHFEGKQLLELDEYLIKLERVLAARRDLQVIARTDATEAIEVLRRACAFANAGADMILVDAVQDGSLLRQMKEETGLPIVFNKIGGGKSPAWDLQELEQNGVSVVIYSTPCLFAAQTAIEQTMEYIKGHNGLLPEENVANIQSCTKLLSENMAKRDRK